MKKLGDSQDYLLRNFEFVNNALSQEEISDDLFPEIVVSFCVFVEKTLKIKLHKRNPVLVFPSNELKDVDKLVSIITKKEDNIFTSDINSVLDVYQKTYSRSLKESEKEAICSVFKLRNKFLHSYKDDDSLSYDKNDILKKMGSVWEKRMVPLAIQFFGDNKIKKSKPAKKYTEHELQDILLDEVRELINDGGSLPELHFADPSTLSKWSVGSVGKEECPRCRSFSFGRDDQNIYTRPVFGNSSNLYKCDNCGLELTQRKYDLLKKYGSDL